jgi:uncharacterized protein (UPF0548 family)
VPILLSLPGDQALSELLARLADHDVTYGEVGATSHAELPPGYRHDRYSIALEGDAPFDLGREALRGWQAHRQAGAILTPENPTLEVGTDLVVTLRSGPTFAVAPCRIVYVTDEPDSFGFAYGTLPGHPEQGEEAFHVRRGTGGETRFEILAFSRPALLLARLGRLIVRRVQNRVTAAYLDGVRQYVQPRTDL